MNTRIKTLAAIIAGSTIASVLAAPPPEKGNTKPDGGGGTTTQVAAGFTAQLAPTPTVGDDAVRLDIDFRLDGVAAGADILPQSWDDPAESPAGSFTNRVGLIQVTALPTGASLVRNNRRGVCDHSPAPDPYTDGDRLDGYGIDGDPIDGVCDDRIDVGETLVVDVVGGGAAGRAAFDVSGIYLTDFMPDKNGEAGQVTFTGIDGVVSTYTFTWKKQNQTPVGNNEVLVQFLPADSSDGVVRFTRAEITATVGSFSVAGFEQTPIDLANDACPKNRPDTEGCTALLAKGVKLDLKASLDRPGDRGVSGAIFKNGVYRIDETRDYCRHGTGSPEEQDVYLDGVVDGSPDFVMQPQQCGFSDSEGGVPYFLVLDINGSRLEIAEDTISAIFEDEGAANGFECLSPLADRRPAIGWLPNANDPIPVLQALDSSDPTPVISTAVQDVTSGACGSGRGSYTRFSYVVYHWVNAVGNAFAGNTSGTFVEKDMRDVIIERISNLQFYVDQLFGCVQQGVNQSTFSSDTGRIRQSFETANTGAKYGRTVELINDMIANALDPRVNDEIKAGACFFDRGKEGNALSYTSIKTDTGVEANAVGNLLSQLRHLRWMVYTNFIPTGDGVGRSFADGNEPPDYSPRD